MTKQQAIDQLIANAVCGTKGLNCAQDCPLYVRGGNCDDSWSDESVTEAVRTLREGSKRNGKRVQM